MARRELFGAAIVLGFLTQSIGSASAEEAGGWEFRVTPYAWLAGIDGDIGSIPGLPSQSVSLSFSDIWDDLDYAGMLFASARRGPWSILFDATAVKTTSTESKNGPLVREIEVGTKTFTAALAGGYTFASSDAYSLESYVGARAWWLRNEFEVKTTLPSTLRTESDADWVDPLVGVALRYNLADRWMLFGSGEVGGFGVGADLEWSLLAGATYTVSKSFGITFGWRHLSVDYDDKGIVYDVDQSGPVLGATFRF